MEDELGLGVAEHAGRVVHRREVVVGAAGDDDLVAVGLEALHEVRTEEPSAAGDEHAHRRRVSRCSASARRLYDARVRSIVDRPAVLARARRDPRRCRLSAVDQSLEPSRAITAMRPRSRSTPTRCRRAFATRTAPGPALLPLVRRLQEPGLPVPPRGRFQNHRAEPIGRARSVGRARARGDPPTRRTRATAEP